MIKKIMLAACIALCSISTAAFANTMEEPSFNSATYEMTINGDVGDTYDGRYEGAPVNLYVRKSGKIVAIAQTTADANGVYSFTINCEQEFADCGGGDFTFTTVSVYGNAQSKPKTYYLVSEYEKLAKALAKEDADSTSIKAVIKNTEGNPKNIDLLSSQNKLFAEYAGYDAKTGTFAGEDPAELDKLAELLVSYKKEITSETMLSVVDKAILITQIQYAADGDEIKTILTEDAAELFKIGETEYYDDVTDTLRDSFCDWIKAQNVTYTKEADLKNAVRNAVVLAVIDSKSGTDAVKSALYAYGDEFDFTYFESNTGEQEEILGDIEVAFEENKVSSVGYVQDILDGKVDIDAGEGGGEGSGGGGGGGGGGSSRPTTSGTPGGMIGFMPGIGDVEYNENDVVESNVTQFNDVAGYDWAKESIRLLTDLGVVEGTAPGVFEPSRGVTRAELCKMVCGIFDIKPNTETNSAFTDVNDSDWFYGYVNALANEGAVNGGDNGEFNPTDYIKRQDVAAIVYRLLEARGDVKDVSDSGAFSDADSVSDYAQKAVTFLKNAGIVNGSDDNKFYPVNNIIRAETAKLIAEVYNYITR